MDDGIEFFGKKKIGLNLDGPVLNNEIIPFGREKVSLTHSSGHGIAVELGTPYADGLIESGNFRINPNDQYKILRDPYLSQKYGQYITY